MKKIFILTGEPSGDNLASKVISKLKESHPNIDYLSVGGEYLKSLGIKSLYDLKEITYLGFTRVLFNLFKAALINGLALSGILFSLKAFENTVNS